MRIFLTRISVFFLAAASLALPARGDALTLKYIDPSYTSAVYATLNVSIDALDVDEEGNLYVVDNTYWGMGTVFIDRYNAADNFTSATIYTSYTPIGNHASGISFDGLGNMYTIECTGARESGAIHKIDGMLSTNLYHRLWYICPTGIGVDENGNLYITGRKAGDMLFGNIYMLNPSKELKVIVPDFVGEGVAVDGHGNIFAANWLDNSLYMFDAESYTPFLIASFDMAPDGVALDGAGNIYVFENTGYGAPAPTPVIRFSPVKSPVPKGMPRGGSAKAEEGKK